MRAEGVLLLLVLPACSVAQVSNAARVGLVLGALGRHARGQEWITRWADDADCVVDAVSEDADGGLRQLDVFCMDDDVVVADKECDAAARPDDTWECLATTVVVDAVLGDDLNDGTAEQPLRTLRACIKRFGEDHSATRKLPDDDDPQLICALRDGVLQTKGRFTSDPGLVRRPEEARRTHSAVARLRVVVAVNYGAFIGAHATAPAHDDLRTCHEGRRRDDHRLQNIRLRPLEAPQRIRAVEDHDAAIVQRLY